LARILECEELTRVLLLFEPPELTETPTLMPINPVIFLFFGELPL
jgi:hypothetical protein